MRDDNGYICCNGCGRVIDQDVYTNDVTFIKTAGGSQLAGNFVRSVLSEYSASHERTLMKGRDEICDLVGSLNVSGGDSIIDQAHAFYTIAVERNFTRGRRTALVAASCLYIACRQNSKAYLLIDFSEYLQINVYVLGAVFLQLCQLLRLEEHPIVQKPVDPSLFIHRFTERLLGRKDTDVSRTAMLIIASMKRDWMQTGRKPTGLCGAALYISALSHGLNCSKSDIVNVVHICEATLRKRLIEFENTESGSLTIEEFVSKANEPDGEQLRQERTYESKTSGVRDVLCEHKDSGVPHFAHGLCRECYNDFMELSGGLQGGSEPPAFQRAEKQRMAIVSSEEQQEEVAGDDEIGHTQNGEAGPCKSGPDVVENEEDTSGESEGVAGGHGTSNGAASKQSHRQPDTDTVENAESESLSDIDDVEVDGYLHNEEEKHYKKIIWEEMNKEYLEEQAAKEAAAAAAKEAYEANFKNCSEDMLAAHELAAATAAAVAKSRKERKQKRAEEAKNSAPPKNAAEATRNMLVKKRLSSKINYDVLEKLFEDLPVTENKKKRVESDVHNDDEDHHNSKGEQQMEPDDAENADFGTEDGYGEEDDAAVGHEDYLYGNEAYEYGYDEDYGDDY